MKNILAVASIAILTAGSISCTTLDPYTQESKTSKATKGAAIGAGVGALLGYLTAKDKSRHDRQKAILIGAGVGGVAGGSVGVYMDKQEAKLTQKLQNSGVSVTRDGDNIILNMPSNITFATGQSTINSGFLDVIESVALVLKEFDQTAIEVAGHTDSVGSDANNQALSERRASSVGNALSQQGIASLRINTIGYGESRPIADNTTDAGKAQNRRVELLLLPITQ